MPSLAQQRGNPNLLKELQAGAQKVSEQKGIRQVEKKSPIQEGGAFNSIQRQLQEQMGKFAPTSSISVSIPSQRPVQLSEGYLGGKLLERLNESVETLGTTKEYFNATQSLFTLYTLGKLNEGLMNTISREDLREIKGIVREFKSVIDSY